MAGLFLDRPPHMSVMFIQENFPDLFLCPLSKVCIFHSSKKIFFFVSSVKGPNSILDAVGVQVGNLINSTCVCSVNGSLPQ